MSALRLIPWFVHQIVVYLAGVFLVVAPFILGATDRGAPLAVFVGTGVLLLAAGVLGKPPAGVANLLPVPVHVGFVHLIGFFLVLSPFLFDYSDDGPAMTTSVFSGLALIVVALLTAFPTAAPAEEEETAEL